VLLLSLLAGLGWLFGTSSGRYAQFLIGVSSSAKERIRAFLARPAIASRVAEGTLAVKSVNIDTLTEHISPDSRTP
jgi:hypothetical protein